MTENATQQPSAGTGDSLGALAGEVDESLHPLLKAVVDNVKLIVGVVAVLILAVGGYAAYDAVQTSNLAEGREKLASIVAQEDAAKRVEALRAFASEAPGDMATSVRLELAEALSAAGDHEGAAALWKELMAKNAADLNVVAALGHAAELSRAGKHADSAAALKALKASAPKGYEALILQRLAYESELSGDAQAALSAWEDLAAANETTDNAFIQSKIARLRAGLAPAS